MKKWTISAMAAVMLTSTIPTYVADETPTTAMAAAKFKSVKLNDRYKRYDLTSATPLYKTASSSSKKISTLKKGTSYQILGTQGNYTKININGVHGFIASSKVKEANVKTKHYFVMAKANKNLELQVIYGDDWMIEDKNKFIQVKRGDSVRVKAIVTYKGVQYARLKFKESVSSFYVPLSDLTITSPTLPKKVAINKNITLNSEVDTYLNDPRRRALKALGKVYKNVPTSEKSASYSFHTSSLKEVLVLSSAKSSKIGSVVKVAFSTSEGMKTGYVLKSKLVNYGDTTISTISARDDLKVPYSGTNIFGKSTIDGIVQGTKESYDAAADALQNTFYVPVLITKDNVLVSGIAPYFFMRFDSDKTSVADVRWSTFNKSTKYYQALNNKAPITPISIEDIFKKFKKTKNYIVDMQDYYKYTTASNDDIHKKIAQLITKYNLENNVFVYIADGQQKAVDSAAEIKNINENIHVVKYLNYWDQVEFNINKIADENIDGFAFNIENITPDIYTQLANKNLQVHIHRETHKDSFESLEGEMKFEYITGGTASGLITMLANSDGYSVQ